MVDEAVERKLYDAASKGDVATLVQLFQQDPYLVHGVPFPCSRNLLHIAAMHGQTSIVEEVLNLNPRQALILDSQQLSPLHIAAAEGQVEISQKLLAVAPETRWWRDSHDMNPVHIAAMKGHVEIIQHLRRESYLPAMERVHRGETVLHLCVKHGQLRALKVLVEKLGELVDAVDDDGETLLHLAVRSNQLETIRYLVEINKTKGRTHNSMGKTPLDVLNESPLSTTTSYSETRRILLRMLPPEHCPWLTDTTMVVVVLIATMAFQNNVNPPGGVWQDDTSSHKAGDAVMAYTHPNIYKHVVRANTTAFVSSIVTIFLITTGLPSKNICFLMIALYAMWVSLIAIGVSYGASTIVINPNMQTKSVDLTVKIVILVFLIIFLLIFLVKYLIPFYFYWKRKTRRQEDLATAMHQRIIYWILQHLETWGCLRV